VWIRIIRYHQYGKIRNTDSLVDSTSRAEVQTESSEHPGDASIILPRELLIVFIITQGVLKINGAKRSWWSSAKSVISDGTADMQSTATAT
jgi:hypothetical protein